MEVLRMGQAVVGSVATPRSRSGSPAQAGPSPPEEYHLPDDEMALAEGSSDEAADLAYGAGAG
eukprot:7570502-Lingulodinium_polyedra.AAC.1